MPQEYRRPVIAGGGKYRAEGAIYRGRKYDSKRESIDAMWLDSLVQQKKIKEVKPQHKLFLECNGKHITTHIVDFLITMNDGRQKFVETKGFATEVWRLKWKLTEANYPETPYLVNPTEKKVLE